MTTAEMLRAEDKADDILIVFEQRGIDVDDKSRELARLPRDPPHGPLSLFTGEHFWFLL